MDNVVQLFAPKQEYMAVTPVPIAKYSDLPERYRYVDLRAQLDLIRSRALKDIESITIPTQPEDLGTGAEGIYQLTTVWDWLLNTVLIPVHICKLTHVTHMEHDENMFSIAVDFFDVSKIDVTTSMPDADSCFHVQVNHCSTDWVDPSLLEGHIDEAWEDYIDQHIESIAPYIGGILENMLSVAFCNSGYATLTQSNKFMVTLPYHPHKHIQIVAWID